MCRGHPGLPTSVSSSPRSEVMEPSLVIGNGFIGSHVVRTLKAQGADAIVLSRSPPVDPGGELSNRDFIVADASDIQAVSEAVRGVSHVVYCAGGLFPAESNEQPLRDVQLALKPLLTVLQILRSQPTIGLTFISSGGTVYGRTNVGRVSEAHPTDPITAYGVLKLASEKYISMYSYLYGVKCNILRCSNVYGDGQPPTRGQGVIAAFLHRILLNEPLTLFGDGSIRRDFVHVSDVAAVVTRLMGRLEGLRVINVGSGEGTTLGELIDILEKATGRRPVVRTLPARRFDVPGIVLDISRLRQLVDFRPIDLAQGVKDTWNFMCNTR